MKQNPHHSEILDLIRRNSGKPTQHTFLDSYLGNRHTRYPINIPTLRKIGKDWMKKHRDLSSEEFEQLLTHLIEAESSTEKTMAGILLDLSLPAQRKFHPRIFDHWLEHLEGWAEVDSVCTGTYTVSEIPTQWNVWKKLLIGFSKSKNIQKRRASIVLLCSPLRRSNNSKLADLAFENCNRLKSEKEILITKAISWVLRSAAVQHPVLVKKYLSLNKDSLPKIALRETLTKLKTGKKTKTKTK